MKPEEAAALRAPFPAGHIGKLPKAGREFDFVAHGYVRDRLLQVDPAWTWTPMGVDEHGLPAIKDRDGDAELWIWLTVCDVTKPGVGVEQVNKSDLAKCLISDAIRNAAMSFGVALDLWQHGDNGEGSTFKAPKKPRTNHKAIKDDLVACATDTGYTDPKEAAAQVWRDQFTHTGAPATVTAVVLEAMKVRLVDGSPFVAEWTCGCGPDMGHVEDCPERPFTDV